MLVGGNSNSAALFCNQLENRYRSKHCKSKIESESEIESDTESNRGEVFKFSWFLQNKTNHIIMLLHTYYYDWSLSRNQI